MSRTTTTIVGKLLRRYAPTDLSELDEFLATASELVDQVVACAAEKGLVLSDSLLERIEAWLAAHFFGVADGLFSQKQTGKASATYQGKTDMGLNSTTYGQQAMALDTSGCLAVISKGSPTVSGFWLGKVASDQTPADQLTTD